MLSGPQKAPNPLKPQKAQDPLNPLKYSNPQITRFSDGSCVLTAYPETLINGSCIGTQGTIENCGVHRVDIGEKPHDKIKHNTQNDHFHLMAKEKPIQKRMECVIKVMGINGVEFTEGYKKALKETRKCENRPRSQTI